MNLENQVTSLELSKQLRELGVKQESLFWWNTWGNKLGNPFVTHTKGGWAKDMTPYLVSAFTVAELGEMLPFFVNKDHVWAGQLMCVRHPHDWMVSYGTMKEAWIKESADTEADARAKMLIHLIKEKIITP